MFEATPIAPHRRQQKKTNKINRKKKKENTWPRPPPYFLVLSLSIERPIPDPTLFSIPLLCLCVCVCVCVCVCYTSAAGFTRARERDGGRLNGRWIERKDSPNCHETDGAHIHQDHRRSLPTHTHTHTQRHTHTHTHTHQNHGPTARSDYLINDVECRVISVRSWRREEEEEEEEEEEDQSFFFSLKHRWPVVEIGCCCCCCCNSFFFLDQLVRNCSLRGGAWSWIEWRFFFFFLLVSVVIRLKISWSAALLENWIPQLRSFFFSAGFDSFRFIGKVPTHAGYWVLPSLFIFWGPVVGHCWELRFLKSW